MSTIAQKLCHDIVEPIVRSPETKNNLIPNERTLTQSSKTVQSTSQKKKVANKVASQNSSSTKQYGGNSVFKKNYIKNTAVNTQVSGSLKCDNNCITQVRKRNNQECCKCNKAYGHKQSSKEIQTLNLNKYRLLNKSCSHCIGTVSCGTQFLDNNPSSILRRPSNKSKSKLNITIKLEEKNDRLNSQNLSCNFYQKLTRDKLNLPPDNHMRNKTRSVIEHVGKRWALSKLPIRGPDF